MREPRFIELDDAVSRIKQACENRPKGSSPFFFMVGAGISYPSVPLATQIVDDCRRLAETYGRSTEAPGASGVDQYSQWFQTAYSEPYQRQEYLQKLIEDKPITHANFRLAHLLLDNTISNIVVTTNFDDFLSKALALFGKNHIVCDHPQTVGRINHNHPMVQIVHLHGSYWFYDCCNLRGELEERAQHSQQTALTMASLLSNILWDRSPLVIGYSGWEGDVFTNALKQRGWPLRSNAYWFCYQRSVVDSLPDWLKSHQNISFVVPKKKLTAITGTSATGIDSIETGQAPVQGINSTTISAEKDQPVLPADTVLDSLIQAFSLKAPELTIDPLGLFARRLNNSLPKDAASDRDNDIYAIKRVIERVTKAKQRDDEETSRPVDEPSDSQLEQVRDALRRADYREAVRHALGIDLRRLSPRNLEELADAIASAAARLKDNSDDEISAHDLVVSIRNEEKKRGFRETLATKQQVANALCSKGFILQATDRRDQAIAAYDELLRRYRTAAEPGLRELVRLTLFNNALALAGVNRGDDAIALYDELMRDYEDTADPASQKEVAKVLFNKAVTLGMMNRSEEEIAVYDQLLARFGDRTEPNLRERVAKALRNKALTLRRLNRRDEEIVLYDDLVRRFGEDTESAIREQVANALINKAVTLSNLKRHDDASAVCLEVVQRYAHVDAPALQELVGSAFNTLGFNLMISGKALRLREDKEAAEERWRRATVYLTKALERIANQPITIGNQAYVAFLLGNKAKARELLQRAIELGGESVRLGELEDADIYRLPEDDEFSEMVRSIPPTPKPTGQP